MTVLLTPRLTLTPCQPADRPDFVALERDPEVMRFLNGGQPVDRANPDPHAAFLMPEGTEPHVWTARRTTGAAFVGWFCLWPEADGSAELGYRLRRQDWGQGLASEGATALVGWGFATRGHARIFAGTMAVNLGSRRVLERLGLTHTRTTHADWPTPIPGSDKGEVEYAITRSDWAARHL